jgi:O-antigen/teichoic acid export membrane protein
VPEKTLGERAIILMIGRGAAVIVGLATPMVLVRVFSQTEFGAYRQINLALLTVVGILTLGFPQSLFYFFPKYPSKRRTFVSQALFSQVIFGCIFLAISLFSGEALAKFFKHDIFLTTSPLIGCIALFQNTRPILESLLIVEQRVSWASLYIVGRDTLRSLSLVIVVLIVPSLKALIYTLLVFEALAFVLVVVYTAIRYRVYRFPATRADFREQTRYSLPIGVGSFLTTLRERLDQYLVIGMFQYSASIHF